MFKFESLFNKKEADTENTDAILERQPDESFADYYNRVVKPVQEAKAAGVAQQSQAPNAAPNATPDTTPDAASSATPNVTPDAAPDNSQPNTAKSNANRRKISRRGFLGLVAALLATARGVSAFSKVLGSDQAPSTDNETDTGDDGPSVDSGESSPYQGEVSNKLNDVRGALEAIDAEDFREDKFLAFNHPETVGGHNFAIQAAQESGDYSIAHWVAYPKNLGDESRFTDYFDNFENLGKNPDNYGAFFEHIGRTHRPVSAALGVAYGHPDFQGLSIREAEDKLRQITDEGDDYKIEEYLGWLKSQHKNTTYEWEKQGNRTLQNLGITDGPDKNGQADITTYTTGALINYNGGYLVKATTIQDDGSKIVMYINPICCNLLRDIKRNGESIDEKIFPEEEFGPKPKPQTNPQTTPQTDPQNPTTPTPQGKDQAAADLGSGADKGFVKPEEQTRDKTPEPVADPTHSYDATTNTYKYTPDEAANAIGHEVTGGTPPVDAQLTAVITDPAKAAEAEEMVGAGTAPIIVSGTAEGAPGSTGTPNNFNAGATIFTGEGTEGMPSADGSGHTVEQNLEVATGAPGKSEEDYEKESF